MKELTELEIKKLCKDCYCPDTHIIRHEIANTPEYLRRYFTELGRREKEEDKKDRYCTHCKVLLTKEENYEDSEGNEYCLNCKDRVEGMAGLI